MTLIVLDRDGVINYDSDDYIKSPEEFNPIPGSLDAIAAINQAGISVVVATNQSGLARGLFDLATLEQIHLKLHNLLAAKDAHVDKIYYCPHAPEDHCDCRKPKTGLMKQILQDYNIEKKNVYVIGDSIRDLQMAAKTQANPILVLTGNGEKTRGKIVADDKLRNIPVFKDLRTAVENLLKQLC